MTRRLADPVLLERFSYSLSATLGALILGRRVLYTLELPWRANAERVSCIPDGVYRVRPGVHHPGSPSAYPVPEIVDVPGRKEIEIHRGNFATDTLGCILVGARLAAMLNPKTRRWELAVADSSEAWNGFLWPAIGDAEFDLHVSPMPPLAGTGTYAVAAVARGDVDGLVRRAKA